MTNAELIEKALERLHESRGAYVSARMSTPKFQVVDLNEHLAALIRKAAEPMRRPMDSNLYCRACAARVDWDHAPDCALIALCRAVVGAP